MVEERRKRRENSGKASRRWRLVGWWRGAKASTSPASSA